MADRYDAVVVGSGPNGLAAAVRLAQADRSVLVVEAADRIGGGSRSEELTLPGYVHDVCSAIHPLAASSPYLRTLPLEDHGLRWVHPEVPLAHPLDDGPAVLVHRDVRATTDELDEGDADGWRRTFGPLVRGFDDLMDDLMRPVIHRPRHPILLARFGLQAMLPATVLARSRFDGPRARAVFAGSAAHSFLDLSRPVTAAYGVMITLGAHTVGWPAAEGGSQSIADALASYLGSLGGEIRTGTLVTSLGELPPSDLVMFDTDPQQVVRIAGDRLSGRVRRQLEAFPRGPGVFKVDYALSEPVPWRAVGAARAGTLHLGGTLEEIAASEAAVGRGEHPQRPYMLVAQPTVFDPTRAPEGRHTLWTYCHVPNGSTFDMTDRMEAQLERFAPGFRDVVLERHVMTATDYEAHNPNMVGGDISGGANSLFRYVFRPRVTVDPYRVGERLYLCSSSTPPGGGVHGMCGLRAAESALRHSRS
ncbi:MAG: NAD(P)/FAD-dependent oxidoreductase [Actinobacteria bacterium]|nr:NAD(P)/FAD-dependent oxidoreductase [Actinomycetota bacterium]